MSLELPTQEQVNAITDLKELSGWKRDIEEVVAKIRVDLEFADGDDEWYSRARSALAYHQGALTRVDKRITRLTKGAGANPSGVELQIKVQEAKAAKKVAVAQKLAEQNEQTRLQIERHKVAAQDRVINFMMRTSQSMIFRKKAYAILDAETVAEIEAAVREEYMRRAEHEIGAAK